MAKEVRTIFIILIGVPVLLIISTFFFELSNILSASMLLNSNMRMAVRQAADLFSQETYKTDDYTEGSLGSSNLPDVTYSAGTTDSGVAYPAGTYVTGKFYTGNSAEEIWKSLYTTDEYKNFSNASDSSSVAYIGNWESLTLLGMALNGDTSTTGSVSWTDSDSQIESHNDKVYAADYKDNLYTPTNIGIPYLDKATTLKMFKWNLAQLLSNCEPSRIRMDDSGNMYVYFRGYRCYVSQATLTINYTVYDLSSPVDKQKFMDVTNIDPSGLSFDVKSEKLYINNGERLRVCIASIKYSMPVAYEGVFHLPQIYNWVISDTRTRGSGMDGTEGYNGPSYKYNLGTSNFTGGGLTNGYANTSVNSGNLIYYVIR